MMTSQLNELIKRLPKTELHLHIEGSLEPELMFALAQRNGVKLPYDSIVEVRQAYNFGDLQSFLDIYYAGAAVLLHEQDFYELAMAYFEKCYQQQIVHAELFFDPQTHTARGVAFSTVMDGLLRASREAEQRWGITSVWILCFLRHLSEEDAFDTLAQAAPYRDYILGIGLDSSEVGHPPSKFARVFDAARQQGYLLVAHAGEEGPPEYVWQALDLLKVQRIDHGVRSEEDQQLMQRLIAEQMPLTVCPLSNLKLKVIPHMTAHNLKRLLEQGVRVTVNSDDPAYFGGYLNENYHAIVDALHLDRQQLIQLIENGFHASFMEQSRKQFWLNQIATIASDIS